MSGLFTIEGKVKQQFQDKISKHLYRVLHNCKEIKIDFKNRNELEYAMMMQNIPQLQISCGEFTFDYKSGNEFYPEFTNIGGANY